MRKGEPIMPIVGVTGDVGAGKSALCGELAKCGAHVIDADSVARALWDDPEIRREAEGRWGKDFFDAPRKEMYARIAAKIFGDDAEYDFASKLLHKKTMENILSQARSAGGVVVAEIPLLYEGGYEKLVDFVVYAACGFEKRVERNAKRSWSADEIERREAHLLPREEKIARADCLLVNDGSEEEWREKARSLWRKISEGELDKSEASC